MGYDEVQAALDETVKRALDDRASTAEMRRLLEAGEGFSSSTWTVLQELGVIGADVPASDGGLGLGVIETGIVADALGRVLGSVPYVSHAVALRLLSIYGTPDQKQRWLEPALAGRAIGCLALAEPGHDVFAPSRATFSCGFVSGTKSPAPGGLVADFAVVGACDDSGVNRLVLVALDGANVERVAVSSLDPARGHARLTFGRAPAAALGDEAALHRALNLAATLLAHEQIGGADRCLEIAIGHARDRVAFGRPIGSYQAIKHRLVDVYARNRLARTHALHAAWAFDHDPAASGLGAAAAHVAAMRAFAFAASEMMQVHGALGVTWDHDGHLFYRRARLLAAELGDLPMWQERIFSLLDDQDRKQAASGEGR